MIFAKCHQCHHAWFIQGEQLELDQLLSAPEWKESFPCPTPLCLGRALRAGGLKEAQSSARDVTVTPIPVQDFYKVVMGLGQGAPIDSVRKLLFESKVVSMEAEPKNGRTIIKSLTFATGTKMHFGISQLGACIYNIEEATDEVRTDGAAEGGDTDREEAGRAFKNEITIRELGNESSRILHSITTVEQPGAESVPVVPATGGVPAGPTARADE